MDQRIFERAGRPIGDARTQSLRGECGDDQDRWQRLLTFVSAHAPSDLLDTQGMAANTRVQCLARAFFSHDADSGLGGIVWGTFDE